MSNPFLAEIRIFPFNFPPKGWAFCNGQLMPISQNTALFSLLGTTYGGDGKSNFALPNMQGSAPMHPGQGPGLSVHDLGETGGSQTVTLLESEIAAHSHGLTASNRQGTDQSPDDQPDQHPNHAPADFMSHRLIPLRSGRSQSAESGRAFVGHRSHRHEASRIVT